MTNFVFEGLNLAITTPFDPDGRIDFQRLEENVDRYIDAGVRSFLFSSGTGMHVYPLAHLGDTRGVDSERSGLVG